MFNLEVKRTNHELLSGFSSINACVTESDAVKKEKGTIYNC